MRRRNAKLSLPGESRTTNPGIRRILRRLENQRVISNAKARFRLGDGAKAHWAGKMSQVAVWGDHVLTEEDVGVLATTSVQSIVSGFDPDLDDD